MRFFRFAVAGWLLLGLPADGAAPSRAREVAISGVDVRLEDHAVHVVFQVEGLGSELRLERLRSGLDIRLVHRIEVLGRRVAGIFPRRRVAQAVLEHHLHYDPLTRTYILERRVKPSAGIQGEGGGAPKPWTTPSLDEALRELANPPALVLRLPRDAASSSLRVRIRSVFGQRWWLGIIPVRRAVSVEVPLEPAP